MIHSFKKVIVLFSALVGLASCSKTTDPVASDPYATGVFVLNAGNFFDNNGTISLFNSSSKTISYDIFQKENTRSLTGGVTGYAEVDGKGIILVDNSTDGKDVVEVVTAGTFKSVATIKGIDNPRSVIKAGTNKAYIVCWDVLNSDYTYKLGYVAVLDLTTNQITKKITVQNGAEGIVIVGTEAFVGNTPYSGLSAITVVDLSKDQSSGSISVGGGATNLVVDANNKIWCAVGKELVRINPSTKAVEARIGGKDAQKSPRNLVLNTAKTTLFFEYSYSDAKDDYKQKGEIYSLNISDTSISTTSPLVKRAFTGLGFDTANGVLYGAITPSYIQAGYVIRYQSNGTLIDSVKAEVAPSGFFFK